MRQTLVSCAAALPVLASLAACASGSSGSTAFAPAPASQGGLRSAGYVAPEIGGDAPRTASQVQQAPVRVARAAAPEPVAIVPADYRPGAAAPQPVTARLDASQPEVPAAPSRDWAATPRAPLPDLDEILVTRESQRLASAATAAAEAPPTRSVLPAPRQATPDAPQPGGYALHLASYRHAEQAEAGWQVLSAAHPDALAPLAPARAVIDLEGQGRFHRLLAGPLSAEAASTACAALERDGDYCAVVPWTGTRL